MLLEQKILNQLELLLQRTMLQMRLFKKMQNIEDQTASFPVDEVTRIFNNI